MGLFDGKVAIVTGAGRGIGRSHALLLASEGAAVVVNDLGGSSDGEGADATPAQQVVDEIAAKGGRAVANYDSVSSWTGAEAMVQQAVDEFGGLDVLVNNAGILRDKMSFNMDEAEWDSGHRRPPQRPLRHLALRRRVLARALEGDRRAREREDREHRVGVGALRQRRPGELRRRQGRHRVDDDRHGPRARAHRRARERDLPGRADAADRSRRRRLHEREGRRVRPLRAGEHLRRRVLARIRSRRSGVTGQVVKVMGGQVQLVRGWRPITEATDDKPWTIESIDAAASALFARSDKGVPPFMPNVGDN